MELKTTAKNSRKQKFKSSLDSKTLKYLTTCHPCDTKIFSLIWDKMECSVEMEMTWETDQH